MGGCDQQQQLQSGAPGAAAAAAGAKEIPSSLDDDDIDHTSTDDTHPPGTVEFDDDEHSPESAGLARGLARSAAQRGASRAAVGRLPAGSSGGGAQHAGTAATTRAAAKTGKAAAARTGKGAAARTVNRARPRQQFRPNPRGAAARVKGGRIRSARSSAPRGPAAATPRGGGRVANVRRVARASERASTGLDLVEAASSSENDRHGQQQQQQQPEKWRAVLKRIPSFVATLAKNTVLGMAVFTTYEGIVEYSPSPSAKSITQSNEDDHNSTENEKAGGTDTTGTILVTDPFASATLSRHAAAGFVAGTVHASLSYAFDGISRWRQMMMTKKGNVNIMSMVRHPAASASSMAASIRAGGPFLPYALHHATSHMVLFGTYEATKRLLLGAIPSSKDSNGNTEEEEQDIDNHYSSLIAVALAGGIAGSAQYIVGDYTERLLTQEKMPSADAGSSSRSQHPLPSLKVANSARKLWSLPLPRVPDGRSLLLAFIPSAIGFVAFEFGREVISDDD